MKKLIWIFTAACIIAAACIAFTGCSKDEFKPKVLEPDQDIILTIEYTSGASNAPAVTPIIDVDK